jgi:hypothetical protein
MINSNDYQQVTRYWNLTSIYLNETSFHQTIEKECYFDNYKLGACFGRIYRNYRPYSTLYSQSGINSTLKFDYPRSPADCKYQFEEVIYDSQEKHVKVNITSQCKTNLSEKNSLGGTSFDIFSESKNELSWCSILDHFNGNYTMTCPVSDDCTNITAFVNYEHFDGVSDSKMKPLLHSITPPATTFCSGIYMNVYLYMYICLFIYVCMYLCMYVYVYIYECISIFIYMYVCMYVCICVYI